MLGALLERLRPAPVAAGFAITFGDCLESFLPEEARRTPVEPALERAFPELLRPRELDLGFASFFGLPTPVAPELEPSETRIASRQLSVALDALLISLRTMPSSIDPGVENDFCVPGDEESPASAAMTPAETVESDMAAVARRRVLRLITYVNRSIRPSYDCQWMFSTVLAAIAAMFNQ